MMMHSLQSNNDFTAPSPAKGSDLAGKKGTILKEQYTDKQAMETALMEFLVFYMLHRRHCA